MGEPENFLTAYHADIRTCVSNVSKLELATHNVDNSIREWLADISIEQTNHCNVRLLRHGPSGASAIFSNEAHSMTANDGEERRTSKELCITTIKSLYKRHKELASFLDHLSGIHQFLESKRQAGVGSGSLEENEDESRVREMDIMRLKFGLMHVKKQLKAMMGRLSGVRSGRVRRTQEGAYVPRRTEAGEPAAGKKREHLATEEKGSADGLGGSRDEVGSGGGNDSDWVECILCCLPIESVRL